MIQRRPTDLQRWHLTVGLDGQQRLVAPDAGLIVGHEVLPREGLRDHVIIILNVQNPLIAVFWANVLDLNRAVLRPAADTFQMRDMSHYLALSHRSQGEQRRINVPTRYP